MKKVYTNIRFLIQVRDNVSGPLRGKEMAELPVLENAWLSVVDGKFADWGTMAEFQTEDFRDFEREDIHGKSIMPCWVDSHTHLVFAAWREQEFVDRINGLTYEQIANRGGGILNSAGKTAEMGEDELFWSALERLNEVISMGTGAIEIKSGYGLTVESELKMLRAINRLKEVSPIPVKRTFLGAHAYPAEYRSDHKGYIDKLVDEMLPAIASEKLADYVDVFCEENYFSLEETDRILEAGAKYGLRAKVHVNQFNAFGGIAMAAKHNALSVDHLEVMQDEDYEELQKSSMLPVALPTCSLFLGIPYTPARTIIDKGLPLAIATDYNPGTTPTGNMHLAVALASIKMKMTPEEAVNAATVNGAAAIELEKEAGSIQKGLAANFIVTRELPSVGFIPYFFGGPIVSSVVINGKGHPE